MMLSMTKNYVGCVLKKLSKILLVGVALTTSHWIHAAATVEKGKTISVEIPVDTDNVCNIEVVRGGEKTNVRVDPNTKKGVYQFAGREVGEETIRWEGKMKFRGLKTLGPCLGDGSMVVSTIESGAEKQAAAAPPEVAPAPPPAVAAEESQSAAANSPETAQAAEAGSDQTEAKAPEPIAPESFAVYVSKKADYAMIKKLDGTGVFSDPSRLGKVHKFCPLTLSQTYDDATRKSLFDAVPGLLGNIFSSKGANADLRFPAVSCVRSNGDRVSLDRSADILVIQKSAVAELASVDGFQRYVPLETIDGPVLVAEAKRLADVRAQAQAKVASRKGELDDLASQKSKEKIGSLTLRLPKGRESLRLCTRKGDADFDLAVGGYFATKKLRLSQNYIDTAIEKGSKLNRRKPFTSTFPDLDAFYLAIQRDPNLCEVYVDYPENLKIIIGALKDQPYELNPLVPVTEAKSDWARQRGYESFAAYEFAQSVSADAKGLKQLSERNVTNIDEFNQAAARMVKEGYSKNKNVRDVVAFLDDEKSGSASNKSATEVKSQRARKNREAAIKRAAKAKAERVQYAKKYPFYAVLSCGFNGSNMSLVACFAGSGRSSVDTELKLTLGSVSKVYKMYQIANNRVGRMQRDGLYIDLPRKFNLRAQNASKSLTLTLKVYDRVTKKMVLQKEAGRRFAVVSARN